MTFENTKYNGIFTATTERHIFTLVNTTSGKYSISESVTELHGGKNFDKDIPIADNVNRTEAEQICEKYDKMPLMRIDRTSDIKRLILFVENPYCIGEWCAIHTEPNTNAGLKQMRKFLKANFASRFSGLEIED